MADQIRAQIIATLAPFAVAARSITMAADERNRPDDRAHLTRLDGPVITYGDWRKLSALYATLFAQQVAEGEAVRLMRAYYAADDARNDCSECENEGPWEHCGPCGDRIGDAINDQLLFLAALDTRDSDGNPQGGDGTAPSPCDDSAGRQASPEGDWA